VATFVESPITPGKKLPFILDIIPHLQVGDANPLENLREVIKNWTGNDRPHIVADAAFGNLDILEEITEWGASATLSCSVGHTPWLWEVLSANLPSGHWRLAEQTSTEILASCHCSTDEKGKRTHQHLLSTGWAAATEEDEPSEEEEVDLDSEMPRFTREALYDLTVAELRDICRRYNIKQGGKKDQFVDNIFQRSETLHQHSGEVERLQHYIKTKFLPDGAPLHDFYKEYFNLVDLADRRWYSVEEHHSHQKWKCKMLLAMLCTAAANSWVYVTKLEYQKWLPWRRELSEKLMGV
jgi:hypothetical protein